MPTDGPVWLQALQDTVEVAAADAGRVDREGVFPADTLECMKANGLLNAMGTEGGDLGDKVEDLVAIARALGGACSSTALIWLMHSQQLLTLLRFAAPAARAELQQRNSESAVYIASVTTESSTGGSISQAGPTLSPGDEGFHLDRHAPIVTGGEVADGFLVKTGVAGPDGSVRPLMVMAYRDELTVRVTSHLQMMGMRGVGNVALDLSGKIGRDRVLESADDSYQPITTAFAAVAHLGWSAIWLGCAESAWRRTLTHLRGRSGHAITSEAIRVSLSEVRLRLETAAAMLAACVAEVRRLGLFDAALGQPHVQLHLNVLKIVAARSCLEAVERMIDVVGVEGYLVASPIRLERSLRDIRAASLIYSDRRLHLANGSLSVLDPAVRTLGHETAPPLRRS